MSHRNVMSCFNVRDLMHFIWEVHWDTSPLWLVLTHTLQYLCSLWYYAGLFPLWYLVVWVCTSSTSSPTEYSYTNSPAGQCAHSWVVCREVQHIQLCSDWKEKPKPMPQCIYERIGPTILHVIHIPTLTVGLLTEYLLKYSNHMLLLF